MRLEDIPDIEIQKIESPLLYEQNIHLELLRLDQVHPEISGNKWFKLKYNLLEARRQGFDMLLTFGGAFSNHLYATAAAGKAYGFKTIGIVRGEKVLPLNPTLAYAKEQGMRLEFVSRSAYHKKSENEFHQWLTDQFGPVYILPEGGTNLLAVKGCTEIIQTPEAYDYISCSVGTGGTIAGILEKNQEQAEVLGFSSLKGGSFLYDEINALTYAYSGKRYRRYQIIETYHFGGYAKGNKELVNFINSFYQVRQVPLDPVYTGKMMYGLMEMIQKACFNPGTKILAIHTGGLQGIRGFNERHQKKNLRILVE